MYGLKKKVRKIFKFLSKKTKKLNLFDFFEYFSVTARCISHTDDKDTDKTSKLGTSRHLTFCVYDCPMADGSVKKVNFFLLFPRYSYYFSLNLIIIFLIYTTQKSRGLQPFLQRKVSGSENMLTFVAEVKYPKGTGIICAVSFQPIFTELSEFDLELTFLATRLKAEGSGIAMWLIQQALSVLRPLRFKNLYCQSCMNVMGFYNRLGFEDIPSGSIKGLYYEWKECRLMTTTFDKLLNKLDSYFINKNADKDIIFILEIDAAPRSFSQIESKNVDLSKLKYEQILDAVSSGSEEEAFIELPPFDLDQLAESAKISVPLTAPEPEPLTVSVPEPKPLAVSVPEPLTAPLAEPLTAPLAEPEPLTAPEPLNLSVSEPLAEPEPLTLSVPELLAAPEPEPLAVSAESKRVELRNKRKRLQLEMEAIDHEEEEIELQELKDKLNNRILELSAAATATAAAVAAEQTLLDEVDQSWELLRSLEAKRQK